MLLFSSGEKWAQMAQQGHPSFWDPQTPLVDPKLCCSTDKAALGSKFPVAKMQKGYFELQGKVPGIRR